MKDRQKGILVVFFGVLCISPDAVLVRFLSQDEKTDPWVITFWKLVFSIPITAAYALYEYHGSLPAMWRDAVEGKWYYLVSVPLQAAVNYGFTFSLAYTSAAKALLIINMNPLWCAVLGRLFLGDVLPWRTIVALILSMGCMLLIFVPEIVGHDQDNSKPEGSISSTGGNLIALSTGILLAANISIMRKGFQQEINLIGTTPLAGIFGCLIVLAITSGDILPEPIQWPQPWQFWMAVMADGMAVGVVYASLTVGPRLANGAEVALVVLLEVILGPLWVFAAYGDLPPIWTLIGGSILLVVLALHESVPMLEIAHREMANGRLSRKCSQGETTAELVDQPFELSNEQAKEKVGVPDHGEFSMEMTV